VTWQAFAEAEPEMAMALRKLLDWIPICHFGDDTSRRSFACSPVLPDLCMFIAVAPTLPKRWDLERDGRQAMHALPGSATTSST
jgi:hypothetical protein